MTSNIHCLEREVNVRIAEKLQDSGTAKYPEDSLVEAPPFFAVIDGVSGLYLPQNGPRFFNGKTGGQVVAQIIVETFLAAEKKSELDDILQLANNNVRELITTHAININDSAFLPSAGFLAIKITNETVRVIQAADCMAVWQHKNGMTDAIPNRMFKYEKWLTDKIAELMKKHNGNHAAMWQEFSPILTEERRQHINRNGPKGCVAMINGQPAAWQYWRRINLKINNLATLLIFTDGLVPYEEMSNTASFARKVMNLYNEGDLREILNETRAIADQKKDKTHETFQEAAAIAFDFTT